MNIGSEIINIIKTEILQDDNLDIDVGTDLLTSGTLDSMAVIRLVASLEQKYEIKIPPTDLVIENFLNVQSIEKYVMLMLSQK